MPPEHVGILINDSMYRGIPYRKTGTESLDNYEEAAKIFGLVPCFFRTQDLSPETGTAAGYIRDPSGYKRSMLPMPRVIHNRSFNRGSSDRQLISQLISQGIFVYNANTRYSKYHVHHMLYNDPLLQAALPDTTSANAASIRSMLRQHGDIILKPCSGSIGRGIMRLRRGPFHDYLTYSRSAPSSKGWRTLRISRSRIPALVASRVRRSPYLVQQRIPLATYKGSSYDIRITIQRGLFGQWEISGMFAKTSSPRTFVSNIAQGGSAHSVHEVFYHSLPGIPPEVMAERTAEFAQRIANTLAVHMPYAADFGLDVAVTSDGRLYFIESNGRDQRYGFREAGMDEEWKETYRKPMAFARYLLNTGSWPVQ
ncbi:YheC/YheD family endospore coat-associated protein [Paenibacillus dakarensis]|uniref:YheC/YheD family endospore coat-associated protein n=1 Tax=Paenibacillus dakarensis TaxID=1527293 RepID=UPI0006D5B168|nr:YheC/YheD family protein [Paenibacillus dakarensis]